MNNKGNRLLLNISVITIFLILVSCDINEPSDYQEVEYNEISIGCLGRVLMSPEYQFVIKSREEYEQLINKFYQSMLDQLYEDMVDYVKEHYPELNENEQLELVEELYKNNTIYKWLTDCEITEVDFEKYTLIGAKPSTLLCTEMEYLVKMQKSERERIYKLDIEVISSSDCFLVSARKTFWLLVEKVPNDYSVEINIGYVKN